MSASKTNEAAEAPLQPPPLTLDEQGQPERESLADLIQWFIEHDPRVGVVNHPAVEELFQWKQQQELQAQSNAYAFSRAEDRLAIGIFQALAAHTQERELHAWIKQLLIALEEATETNRQISEAYNLDAGKEASALQEALKIPAQQERTIYLMSCWLEALCTAEIRVLGWVYPVLYNKPYSPQ